MYASINLFFLHFSGLLNCHLSYAYFKCIMDNIVIDGSCVVLNSKPGSGM